MILQYTLGQCLGTNRTLLSMELGYVHWTGAKLCSPRQLLSFYPKDTERDIRSPLRVVRCGVYILHINVSLLLSSNHLIPVALLVIMYYKYRHIMAALAHHSRLWEQEHMSQQRVPTSYEPVTGVLTFP